MALTKTTTLNEFFVRLSDDGQTIKGMHVADLERVLENGAVISSKMLQPRSIAINDAVSLGTVAQAINLASLATIDSLVSAKDAAVAARDAAISEKESLAARLAELEPPTQDGVPQVVTRRQARQALILNGLFDNVQVAIDAIPDLIQREMMQSEWDDSQTFERHRASLLTLAGALGLTSNQVDALFIQAASL